MNLDFETAMSAAAEDPSDFVTWSVIIEAFENKVSTSRTVNGNLLSSDIILLLASDDFENQGTTTTLLHGNATGNPSWGAVVTNDITNSAVTYAKMQSVSTTSRFLGRITAGSGTIEELTGTQATSLLDVFATTSTTKGLVPGSNSAGTSYFLRADGTWALPAAGAGTDHSSLINLDYASAGHTGFEPTISAGTTSQYYRGDKTWVQPNHNSLAGLQGGIVGEYYHITAAKVTPVNNITTTSADSVPTGLAYSSTGIITGTDGTQSAYIILTWDAIATSTFSHYQVRYNKDLTTNYTYLNASTNTITINGLSGGVAYDFAVESVNKYGTHSGFSADLTVTVASDTGAPDTVTGVTAVAGIQYVIVEWTHVANSDRASYNIYRNIADTTVGATVVGSSNTDYFIDGGRTGGTALFYWVKAVDTSGNESAAFSNPSVTATPRNVENTDVTEIAADKILINGIVYLSNWRHASDITKIDGGTIYTNSIHVDAINASTLAAIVADLGSVTAGNIVITTGTDLIWLNHANDGSLNIGGNVKASAPFRVTAAGALTATSATISGSISATSGTIGGWTVGATYLYLDGATDADSSGMVAADYPFYAGKKYADRATAPFRVTPAGVLTASGATVSGAITSTSGTIGGWTIASDAIYHGTKTTSGYTPAATDVTLSSGGSLHTRNFYVNADGTVGIRGTLYPHLFNKVASAVLRNGLDTTEYTSQNTHPNYQQRAVYTFTNGFIGEIRFGFELRQEDAGGGGTGKARVYRTPLGGASAAIGVEINATTGVSYLAKTDDITQNFNPGDTIELWLYSPNGDITVYATNIGLYYSDGDSGEVVTSGF